MAHGNGIADIYRSVIADVISNMKEAFLDENIDIDVLSQLKKEWEDKVNSSGCVDLESTSAPPAPRQHIAPPQPPVRPNPLPPQRMGMPPQRVIPISAVQAAQMGEAPIRMAYTAQGQQNPVRVFNPQFGAMPNFATGPVLLVQQANGQGIPMTIMQNQLQQQQQQHRLMHPQQIQQQHQQQHQQQTNQLSHMNQMDGNLGAEEGSSAPGALPKSSICSLRVRGKGASKKKAIKMLGALLQEFQLDGNGGGMSDSSSDDEPDDEDDPLRRIVDRIGNGDVENGENAQDEEPLNSDDDQSDDEDLTQLFDADNVVMCQFEKVNRARTKWKFQLKDGIMHIDKKDYCFQKCSGEAEW